MRRNSIPTDDILWKKVDDLKSQAAEKPKPFPPSSVRQPDEGIASSKPQRRKASYHASKQDLGSAQAENGTSASTQASILAPYPHEWTETIRKVVKGTGKEVAFTRLTPEEKGQLTDVVYSYRRQGVKTSENEVLRIAINLLLEDHRANGKHSFLQRVIAALLA